MKLPLVQKVPCSYHSTAHRRPPKGETRIPVSPLYEHRGCLLRSILRQRSSDSREEVVPSMDTSFCVMGVERFAPRRGTPTMIWSDNGTNFIGTEKEFRENIEKGKTIKIAAELAHKGIKWRFNPPVRCTKGESGRGWSVVLRAYCTPSSVHAASEMRCWTLLYVSLNTH